MVKLDALTWWLMKKKWWSDHNPWSMIIQLLVSLIIRIEPLMKVWCTDEVANASMLWPWWVYVLEHDIAWLYDLAMHKNIIDSLMTYGWRGFSLRGINSP